MSDQPPLEDTSVLRKRILSHLAALGVVALAGMGSAEPVQLASACISPGAPVYANLLVPMPTVS